MGRDFSNWIKERIEKYGFKEGVDFVINAGIGEYKKPTIEYHLSPSMSKEISMVERSDKGKEVRTYFIRCEEIVLQIAVPAIAEISLLFLRI